MTYNDLEWLFHVKIDFPASTFRLKGFDFQRPAHTVSDEKIGQ